MIYNVLLIVQIIVALGVIGLVLVQHGKGADAGAAFGGGASASGTVFGSRGAANFLSRTTAILALVFFINSLALAWLVSNAGSDSGTSIVDTLPVEDVLTDVPGAPEAKTAPVAEAVDVPAAASDTEEASEQPSGPVDVPQ
ncbi:MAG: Preprotein translocase subunit SecG (TC 3.A.5.1.1) [uncultured Thiotrichaceae bacterium]|uniref:Protein-export membrane protein SecG n=1 Tax=uncultured Thiotrichaceae bacterium TaxID=298394 RepID=A0A6S6TU34_9GAMM|nr:MAG: Preprotein translocase subunit SecG (TC 3.A.5.1.1) [uncultured Thiotrichaceae bacterium]